MNRQEYEGLVARLDRPRPTIISDITEQLMPHQYPYTERVDDAYSEVRRIFLSTQCTQTTICALQATELVLPIWAEYAPVYISADNSERVFAALRDSRLFLDGRIEEQAFRDSLDDVNDVSTRILTEQHHWHNNDRLIMNALHQIALSAFHAGNTLREVLHEQALRAYNTAVSAATNNYAGVKTLPSNLTTPRGFFDAWLNRCQCRLAFTDANNAILQ